MRSRDSLSPSRTPKNMRHDVAARFGMALQRLRSATGGPGANNHEATMFIRVLCAATYVDGGEYAWASSREATIRR
jgi:hypothetical protein